MSCGSYSRGSYHSNQCVADVVKNIIKAQRKANDAMEDTCLTSCDQSIDDLLLPFEENRRRLRFDTIPFILYCKESCKPFVGSGIIRERRRRGRDKFVCIESPIFRAKSFVDGDETCVRLELLKPVRDHRRHDDLSEFEGEKHHDHDHHKHGCKGKSVCDFFDHDVEDFRATGVCITVDLKCFCGISCLDPITPVRARERDDDC